MSALKYNRTIDLSFHDRVLLIRLDIDILHAAIYEMLKMIKFCVHIFQLIVPFFLSCKKKALVYQFVLCRIG